MNRHLTIKGRPFEIAKEYGLEFCYCWHNGNVNGAVSFWKSKSDTPTTFAVIEDVGQNETWQQTLQLLAGEWPIKEKNHECAN